MLRAYWEIEVRDSKGKLLKRKRFRSHSYLTQFIAMIRGQQFHVYGNSNSGNTSLNDITGTSRGYPYSSSGLYYTGMSLNCGAGSSEYGIVVGTGTTPNSTSTYALASIITHGVGAGQLSYGNQTFEPLTISGNDVYFRVIRTFTNSSGASITVNEVGLYVKAYDSITIACIFCIARDLISGGIVVPNGATLTIRYIQKITVA